MHCIAGQGDTNITDLDITVFVASATDSLDWIERGFPMPLPYNGTVCHQVVGDEPGLTGVVSEVTALRANQVSQVQPLAACVLLTIYQRYADIGSICIAWRCSNVGLLAVNCSEDCVHDT